MNNSWLFKKVAGDIAKNDESLFFGLDSDFKAFEVLILKVVKDIGGIFLIKIF